MRAEKIAYDTIIAYHDNGSQFLYTGKDWSETDRVLKLLRFMGFPADDVWGEKCERESKLLQNSLARDKK